MTEQNPVVLLCGHTWHIVESSRGSRVALCGHKLEDRRAHSRLQTIGRQVVCSNCLDLFDDQFPPPPQRDNPKAASI